MAGKRQPTDVVIANGRKHLSKAEEAERRAGEVKVSPAKTAKPPKWLPETLKKDFRAIGKRLIASGLSGGPAPVAHCHGRGGKSTVAKRPGDGANTKNARLSGCGQLGQDPGAILQAGPELCQRYGPDRHQPLPPGCAGHRQASDGGQQPHVGADPGRHGSVCLSC